MKNVKQNRTQTKGILQTTTLVLVTFLIGVLLNACQSSMQLKNVELPSAEKPLVSDQSVLDFKYPTKPPSVAEGKKLFSNNCASCHGFGGTGKSSLTQKYVNSVTPSHLFKVITNDIKHPSFKDKLTIKERWDTVMYLRYEVFGLPENLDDIKTKFGSNCAVCHGTRGHGDGSLHYFLNPLPANFTEFSRLYEKTDEKLFDEISEGIPWTAMPPWKNRVDKDKHFTFDDKFRWELVKYIRQFGYEMEKDPLRDEKLFGKEDKESKANPEDDNV